MNTMVPHLWQYLRYWWNEVNFLSTRIRFDRLYNLVITGWMAHSYIARLWFTFAGVHNSSFRLFVYAIHSFDNAYTVTSGSVQNTNEISDIRSARPHSKQTEVNLLFQICVGLAWIHEHSFHCINLTINDCWIALIQIYPQHEMFVWLPWWHIS